MRLIVACILALPALALAKSNAYCKGQFAKTEENCSKFSFRKQTDAERCGNRNKGIEYHGIKLANCTTFYDISGLPEQSIDDHTNKMAHLITNVFENGDTKMGYAAVQKLGDCRGYTCGYIGFTTGTNDAFAVVKEYTRRSANNPLARYKEELDRLSQYDFGDPRRDDTSGLQGFKEAWNQAACSDPVFIRTQLDIGHSMYLKPSVRYAASADVRSNLGKAIFYDTIVQHGWQYVEPDINLPQILYLTGPKKSDETEQQFLTRFLTTRRQLVCCFPGDAWNDSSDRMADLQKLVDNWDQNKDLKNPVHLQVFQKTITGKENMDFDTQNCKSHKMKDPGQVQAVDLPLPTCPQN